MAEHLTLNGSGLRGGVAVKFNPVRLMLNKRSLVNYKLHSPKLQCWDLN